MNLKEQLKSLNKDYELRSYLFSGFSLFTTFVFLIYNLVLGIVYSAIWNFSISFYYLILLTLRTIIITKEKTWRYDEISIRNKKRLKLFRFTTKILLVMDLALIIPISLMVLSKRNVDISMIPTIGIAAYTTYKVTFATINYFKTRGQKNLSLFGLKIINLKDAIVSILTLQNTMVMGFGNETSMLTLTAYTSAGMLVGMFILTILSIRKGYQYSTQSNA